MLFVSKDSPLNSAFVVENLCGEFKPTINFEKIRQFFHDYMVDFCRPGHIYLHNSIS